MLRGVFRLRCAALLSSLLLVLPAAAAADPSIQSLAQADGSATCGNVAVTWTMPSHTPSFDSQTVALHASDANGNAVFDYSQATLGLESLAPDWCGDLLGDGSQVLSYRHFGGGAHCCNDGAIVALDGSGRHFLDWSLGSYGLLEPQQLDSKGALEIPAASPIFSYYGDLPFAYSPALPIVYRYDGTGYVDATAQFPAYFTPELAKAESDLAAARGRPALDQEAFALHVYALHILLGDGEKALPGIQSRVTPTAWAWLSAHADDVRGLMAKAYALPGGPGPATASAPAPAVSPTLRPIAPPPAEPAQLALPLADQPPAQQAPPRADQPPAAEAPPESAVPGLPDALTDGVRADILAAIDRANAAWANAGRSLDTAQLTGNVADRALSDDLAEIADLRSRGQTRNNVNTAFSVSGVSLSGPGQAVVHTHETWSAEIYAGRTLLQRTPAATYNETYTVEFRDNVWIVTSNDL
jgi:hypothetical protein